MSVLGLVLLSAVVADAQTPNGFLPPPPNTPPATGQYNEPEFVPYVNDLQLFDQPDLSAYGRGPRPPEGWFGSIDYLNWTQVSPPRSTIGQGGTISVFNSGATTADSGNLTTATFSDALIRVITRDGVPDPPTVVRAFFSTYITGGTPSGALVESGTITAGAVDQTSTLDTTFMRSADFTSGGRLEFGRVVDQQGWIVSGFGWGSSTQSTEATNAAINFGNAVGFVDVRNANNNTFVPDGYDDDLDGDGVYGRNGRDRGTQGALNGITIYTGLPDGIPDPEAAGPPVGIDYDDAVPLATRFATVQVQNKTNLYSLEAMKIWQVYFGPRGGVWEAFIGPRALNLQDQFTLFATAVAPSATNPNPISVNTYFDTTARNYLFGGQFGGRWSRQTGRWQFGYEARGFLAANYQHVTQQGQLGDIGAATTNLQTPIAFAHRANQTEFSPAAEMRLNLKYQVFRSLYVQAGYSALFAQNIARGARMTFYNMPTMGILTHENDSTFFVHGLNIGLVVNR
jgi:hypothetical protein